MGEAKHGAKGVIKPWITATKAFTRSSRGSAGLSWLRVRVGTFFPHLPATFAPDNSVFLK